MREVSNEYKTAMESMRRDRAYISISLGVVNGDAQESAHVTSACADWCNPNAVFSNNQLNKQYATMEEDYFKMDGSMYFLPDEIQPVSSEIVTEDILGAVMIEFGCVVDLKGLTIEFGATYPTEFIIEAQNYFSGFLNSEQELKYAITDSIGETSYLKITPVQMVGGQQRLRINRITMGVGLSFGNSDVQNFTYDDYVSTISEELPSEDISVSLFDKFDQFNVDDKNSYIGYLETGQEVKVSFGITLRDGSIEWLKHSTLYLSDWDSQKGYFNISAIDKLSSLNDEYTKANRLYTRTAYDEAISIFEDAGLSESEYIIDDVMKDIVLYNPMPEATRRECLQLLANASRCIIRHNEQGQIVIKANFANTMTSDEITVSSNTESEWSNAENIVDGANVVYADMTNNFFKMDGSMYFLPEDGNHLNNGYVSAQISNYNGDFETIPKISIDLPATYSYRGISIEFGGNPAREITVYTYVDNTLIQTEYFYNDDQQTAVINTSFKEFNRMVIEFANAKPYNRVVVNKIEFGELSDYTLKRSFMMSEPHGFAEEKVKSVNVRVYQFAEDENGEPYDTENYEIVKRTIGIVGKNILLENQLISTMEHAQLIASWLANHYSNNVTYSVNYRGEPRLEAGDIIKMESTVLKDLQVEIEQHNIQFDGGFSGSLTMRKAMKVIQTRGS